jgi:ABC-type transporter Mla subunit MlaD
LGQVHIPDIGINANDLKKNLTNVTNQAGQALQGAGEAIGSLLDNLQKGSLQDKNK